MEDQEFITVAMQGKVVIKGVAAYIAGLFPTLNSFEQRLSRELYRFLT